MRLSSGCPHSIYDSKTTFNASEDPPSLAAPRHMRDRQTGSSATRWCLCRTRSPRSSCCDRWELCDLRSFNGLLTIHPEDKRHLNPGADSAAGAPEAVPAGFKRIEQIEYGDDFVSSVKAAIASSKSAAGGALPASTTESSLTTTTAASVVVNGKWVVASPTSTSAAPGPSSVGGANYGFALIAAYRYLHEG